MIVRADAGGGVAVAGDPDHPANFGRLCSKGAALGETLSLEDRLLVPRIHGAQADCDMALDYVAGGLGDIIARHGRDAVALYVSGQLLTEDYYVANKFAKGFIGTANIDTNSRLCMASSVAGHKRAFGSDTVPGCYEDIEEAELVVLVGSNLAWCHPVLFQRLAASREERNARIVVIDPRRTVTAEIADLHLPIAPGSDVALFNGLLAELAKRGFVDHSFVEAHTQGLDAAMSVARACGVPGAAAATGIDQGRLARFYRMFAETERVVTLYSQGVNQSSAGTDKVNAIINCHLLTGRIGRAGMGPFSVTGQPNAMGGREVGGLANQLAAHMDLDDPTHHGLVRRFWRAPHLATKPGLKAIDLFRAVGRGEVKAVWIMATNPAASLPEADEVAAALRSCPLVVVSDVTATTRTAGLAHVLLPAAGWGEKEGTVTNSERRISRQRAFLRSQGMARPDWWIVSEVARRMGFAGFDYENPAAIFREHAALSALGNDGGRDFDIGAYETVQDDAYETMAPFQWPQRRGELQGARRLFADGRFFFPDGRARFVATPWRAPASRPDDVYPLVLNTGRIRDQWHTMTRTGKAPRLSSHIAEPFVEIHPDTAMANGIGAADLVAVESVRGRIIARAQVTDRQARGGVFVPMHWTDPFAVCAQPDSLVEGHVDPASGQPELKFTPVRVARFPAAFHAFLVSKKRPELEEFDYWAVARIAKGWRAEFAHAALPAQVDLLARRLLGPQRDEKDTLLTVTDRGGGIGRYGHFVDGALHGALYFGHTPVAASRAWLCAQLGEPVAPQSRFAILAGRPGAGQPDKGAIVCACYGVGTNEIVACARTGAVTVAAIGEKLRAGTNCGSCRSEIGRIIEARYVKEAV